MNHLPKLVWVAAALAVSRPAAAAPLTGTVFVDSNQSGSRDTGEPGLAGVAVSNGREIVETDAAGRYLLPPGPHGRVFLTRPDGFECAVWVRKGAGDFALVPAPRPREFFFIHLSDVHAYRHSSQVWEDYGVVPPYVPTLVAAWFAVRDFERRLVPRWTDAVIPHLRAALQPYRPTGQSWDLLVPSRYFDELFRSGSELGRGEDALRASFEEIHALGPDFLVNTGDIVFDSNRVPAGVSEDWMSLYRDAAERPGRPVYPSIGNHELGRIEHADASPDDPMYGPGFFRHHFGTSVYSFDRGDFHFVALDTHSQASGGEDETWRRNRMRPEVKAWLEADLARSSSRTVVLLNHEPFFEDPDWNMGDEFWEREVVDDEGVLERFGVDYTLTGHVHLPGIARTGTTTHISTGALSGMHWLLPPSVHPRGYRLVYAREGHLYTVWKRTGEPVLGLAEATDAAHVVAVAADRRGPFARVRLFLDGEPVAIERWGDYFVHARLEPARLLAETLCLEATRSSGETLVADLTGGDTMQSRSKCQELGN